MKKYILLLFAVLISISASLFAQTITLLGSTSVSAIGNGTGGKPTLNWNIPAGKNRVMMVHFWFERDHRPTVASNYPSGNLGADYFPLTVGGINMTGRTVLRSYFIESSASSSASNTQFSTLLYRYTLSDSQGLPTGATTFDFSGIITPANIADEVVVSIEVYGNVSPTTAYTATGSNSWYETATEATTFSLTPTAPIIPSGRLAADIMYVGAGSTSKDENISISSTGWTAINNVRATNNAGAAFSTASPNPLNEADGVSLVTAYRNGTAATTLTKSSSQRIAVVRLNIVPLLPLAKPSITGNIYIDTDGPSNINGTSTNGGGLYVNLVDANGNLVYSAMVSAAGAFTIPVGYATEGESYKLQLSKNTGTLGATAPIKVLNSGWTAVGEATSATGNDGTSDNVLSITAGTINITGLRYGIKTCNSGSAAPIINATSQYSDVLSSYSIPCGSLTANLTTLTASNTPLGTTITWHTSANATDANKVTATAISGTVKMYAAFYDAIALCYSPTKEIVVGAPICAGDDNYSATPIIAGVGATFPSIFNNDTYNGINIATLPPYTVEFLYELWTPANATVDLAGNGSLIIPASVLPGTYTYYYKICDKDPDTTASSNCAIGAVTFVVIDPCAISATNPDSDADGVSNSCDLDDDNDGILDTVEKCGGSAFIGWTEAGLNTLPGGNTTTTLAGQPITVTSVVTNSTVGTTKFLGRTFTYSPMVNADAGTTIGGDIQLQLEQTGNTNATTTVTFSLPPNKFGDVNVFLSDFERTSFKLYAVDATNTKLPVSAWAVKSYETSGVSPASDPNPYVINATDITFSPVANSTFNGQDDDTMRIRIDTGTLRTATKIIIETTRQDVAINPNDNGEIMLSTTCVLKDTDIDGTPDYLDLDSDNDGCLDAIEGGAAITSSQLVTATGTVSVGLGSTASNQNLGNAVNANGVPTIVGGGQTVGDSANAAVNSCFCYKPAATDGNTYPTKHGITALGRAGAENDNWPMTRQSAWTVLEAKTKGFVVNRVAFSDADNNPATPDVPTAISATNFVEGMMVYDNTNKCLKVYTSKDGGTSFAWYCMTTQTCPQ